MLSGQLDQIDVRLRYAVDLKHLELALSQGFAEVWDREAYDFLFLHLSALGSKHGIELSNGESVPWANLESFLAPINQTVGGRLILSLSACEGMSAIWSAAMRADSDTLPYAALIGSSQSPTWSQTAIGYATLYHHMAMGNLNLENAAKAMTVASGHKFEWKSTQEEQQRFQELARKLSVPLGFLGGAAKPPRDS